jgi:hypothetical protein
MTDSVETWYEHHAIGGQRNLLFFNFSYNMAGARTCEVVATQATVPRANNQRNINNDIYHRNPLGGYRLVVAVGPDTQC